MVVVTALGGEKSQGLLLPGKRKVEWRKIPEEEEEEEDTRE